MSYFCFVPIEAIVEVLVVAVFLLLMKSWRRVMQSSKGGRSPDLPLGSIQLIRLDAIQEVMNFGMFINASISMLNKALQDRMLVLVHVNIFFEVPVMPVSMVAGVLELGFRFVSLMVHVVQTKVVILEAPIGQAPLPVH